MGTEEEDASSSFVFFRIRLLLLHYYDQEYIIIFACAFHFLVVASCHFAIILHSHTLNSILSLPASLSICLSVCLSTHWQTSVVKICQKRVI